MIAGLFRRLGRLTTAPARSIGRRLGRSAAPPEPGDVAAGAVEMSCEEAEQLVTAALLAGLIDAPSYHAALAFLAQSDNERLPLQVPPI